MATLQEQMAGPSRPRFNGWLTMAPEMDPPPVATTSTFVPAAPVVRLPALEQPTASTHGFGMLGQATRLPQRKKKRATFSIGSPGLSDDETAVSTERGGGSGRSSRASSDGPDFDVRASFAPMPVWGQSRASAQPNTQDTAPAQTVQDTQHEDEPDTGGLSFAGRQWKGKTVHAVEQELEALRDTKLMSHAPDPAYLASRLEGLRRNLEVEERRPTYVQYDEDYMMDDDELPITAIPDPSNHPYQHIYGADLALQMGVRAMPALAHRPVSNASSVSLAEGETPNDLAAGLEFDTSLHQMDATAAAAATAAAGDHIKIHDPHAIDMIGSTTFFSPTKAIDPAARAAALEARIEIRTLRRSDLDQVRDLHAFHGDLDRSPDHTETYASTASFLLRLLVDDRHVCLVAVAKPIPEPAAPLPAASDLTTLPATKLSGARSDDDDASSDVASDAVSAAASSPALSAVAEHDDDNALETIQSVETLPPPAMTASGNALAQAHSNFSSSSTSPKYAETTSTTASSLFSAPVSRPVLRLSPRGADGRINNTPATSVFSDMQAERGAPQKRFTLDDLPGPTEERHAPVKKVLSIPPPRPIGSPSVATLALAETETIVGVASAQLSLVTAPSEDSLWGSLGGGSTGGNGGGAGKGGSDGDENDAPSSVVDIHLLTLAISPEERGQGLGAKLLSALHGECMAKSRLMALRKRVRGPIPAIAALTPKFIDLPEPGLSLVGGGAVGAGGSGTSVPVPPTQEATRSETRPRPRDPTGKFLARTYLEVHPSNCHALALYSAHGFVKPAEESRAVKKGFYRGDTRISTSERAKPGGTDAWILERWDGSIPASASSPTSA